MRIHDMFAKDIDRNINGVVKVAQVDDESIRSELEEYVITRELRRHFAQLLERYAAAIDAPTDKIGVWISGFFGSGKSHFLKMMSYLLSNREVAGKPAIDYFADKFEDPLMAAQAKRCVSVPCESILFNIDNKGPANKDNTAILKVFATVFYEHLGYYGQDLRLVRLEQAIERKGKTDEFRAAFAQLTGGDDWLQTRESYDFYQDDVIVALQQSGVMSAEAATRWFDGTETASISIDSLVDDINEYVEARRAQSPTGTFRLLFMVDEVGQYIGADVSLMLNLQTLVEELGARCGGSVWVMVTSQEAIDEITRVAGNDFSKIQGRFNTRLSLSSSSVDEVIKARVLAKTPQAEALLKDVYAANTAALRNLYAFQEARGDLGGYADAGDFTASFPFVGYQFKVMQDVLTQLRRHGSSGKHLSGGERSMLSGFQEAAQAVSERDEYAVVPFWRFYDTLSTFLEGYIRRVIERCDQAAQDGDKGLFPEDVQVLKLLFLIRYVDDVKATLNNVTIMMADRMDADVQDLRERVSASLTRLERQNYIARTGEVYTFLTDEEQDIAREIAQTQVEPAQVVRRIGGIVYAELLADFSRVSGGQRDFQLDRYVDEQAYSQVQGGLVLRTVTPSWRPGAGEGEYVLASASPNQVLVVLDEEADYYSLVQRELRIERYVATMQGKMAGLPESTRSIIVARNAEKKGLHEEAKHTVERALAKARVYVAGRELTEGRSDNAKRRIEFAAQSLIDAVYSKRGLVQRHPQTEQQLRTILTDNGLLGEGDPNAQACEAVAQVLAVAAQLHQPKTMKDLQDAFQAVPYGWSEFDVAGVVAQLVHDQKARVRVSGANVEATDAKLPEYLHNRRSLDKVVVEARRSVPAGVLNGVRALLRDVSGKQDVPTDEDGLVQFARTWLTDTRDEMAKLLRDKHDCGTYPGRAQVEALRDLCVQVLGTDGDPATFLGTLAEKKDDFLNACEDMEEVEQFFARQIDQFEAARNLVAGMAGERSYLEGDAEATQALRQVEAILADKKPYQRISQLAGLCNQVRQAQGRLVCEKRNAILDDVKQAEQSVKDYAEGKDGTAQVLSALETTWTTIRSRANSATSCVELDALVPQLDKQQLDAFQRVDKAVNEAIAQVKARAAEQARIEAEKKRIAEGGETGEARVVVTPPQPRQPVKPVEPPKVTRSVSFKSVSDYRSLRSEEDVDRYIVELQVKIKAKLHDALEAGEDGIRLV